jgi:5-methylcytosine-specific restriction enzyme A
MRPACIGAGRASKGCRRHVAYERDPSLRQRKLDQVRRDGQPLACEACGFEFAEVYGEGGSGFIERHHIVPLSVTGHARRTISDLALLCWRCT